MPRTVVIANPAAGRLRALETLERDLAPLGPVEIWHEGDTRDLARRACANGAERIVAAGGDGTLHEVVSGVGNSDVQLGIIPLGTGNDLARTLGLPFDVASAVAAIARGKERVIDRLSITTSDATHVCVNVSAGGFAGKVDERLAHDKTGWLGPLAYLRSAVETLLDLPVYAFTITLGDEAPRVLTGCSIAVANGRSVAGGLTIAPTAEVDDGLLDVVVFRATTSGELARIVPLLLAGSPIGPDDMFFARTAKVEIKTSPEAPFNADGELIGYGPIQYEIHPRALRVCVP